MARQIETWQRSNVANSVPSPIVPSGRSGLAEGLGEVANQLDRYAQGRDRVDEAVRQKKKEDAEVRVAKDFSDSLLTISTGAMEAELNAKPGGEGHVKTIQTLIDEEEKRVTAAQPDELGKTKLLEKYAALRANMVPAAIGFEATARSEKRVTDTKGTVNVLRNLVTSNPGMFDTALAQSEEAINALTDVSPAKKELLLKETRFGLSESALGTMALTQPQALLKQLGGPSKWDQTLNPEQKLQFMNSARAEISRRETEARQRAAEARAEYMEGFQDYVAGVSSGYVQPNGSYSDVSSSIGGKRGEVLQAQLNLAIETGDLTRRVNTATPEELVKMQVKQEGDLSSPENFRMQAAQAARTNQLIDERNRAIDADASLFTVQNAPNVRESYLAMKKDPGKTKDYIRATLAEQERLGRKPEEQRILPENDAAELAAQFYRGSEGGGQKATELIQNMSAQYGEYWPKVYAQMSKKLPAAVNVIANMTDPASAELLSRTLQAGGNEELEKNITSTNVTTIKNKVATELAAARKTFSFQNGTQTYNQLNEGTYTLALAIFNQNGGDAADAAEKAAAATMNSLYTFADSYRIPNKRADKISDVDAIQESLGGIFEQPDLRDIDTPAGVTTENYIASLRGYGKFVTSSDETGVTLTNQGGYAVTRGGKPIVWSWDDLEKRAYNKAAANRAGQSNSLGMPTP